MEKFTPIAIDFDGTIVTHEYPRIGKPVPYAIETMIDLQKQGANLILFTMRSGKELEAAVKYCKDNGIVLYGKNINPSQTTWTKSPKAYGELYIDDAGAGCPLIRPEEGRPYVDWLEIRKIVKERLG